MGFDPISAIFGLGSDLLGAFVEDQFADSNAKDQFNRQMYAMQTQDAINRANYKSRYQWTTEDMRRAGLNPILAASGGFSVGNAPTVSLPSPSMATTPTVGSIATSARDFASIGKMEVEKQKMLKEVNEIEARTKTELEKAIKIRAESGMLGAKEREAVANIERLQTDSKRLMSEAMMFEVEKNVYENNIKLIKLNMERIRFELNRLREVSKVYSGPSKEIYGWLEAVARIFGLRTGVGLGITGKLIK